MKTWLLAGTLLAALVATAMYATQSFRMAELRAQIAQERPRVERLESLIRLDFFHELKQDLESRMSLVDGLRSGDADLAKLAADTRTNLGSLPLEIERLVARGDFLEATTRPTPRGRALRDPVALDRALRAAGLEATRPPLPLPDGTLSFVIRRHPAAVRR